MMVASCATDQAGRHVRRAVLRLAARPPVSQRNGAAQGRCSKASGSAALSLPRGQPARAARKRWKSRPKEDPARP